MDVAGANTPKARGRLYIYHLVKVYGMAFDEGNKGKVAGNEWWSK